MDGQPGRRFFLDPQLTFHRRYEALRAFFVEDRPLAEVAAKFGYTCSPWTESVVVTNLRFRKHSRLSSRISRCTRLRLTSKPQRRNSAVIRRLP